MQSADSKVDTSGWERVEEESCLPHGRWEAERKDPRKRHTLSKIPQ